MAKVTWYEAHETCISESYLKTRSNNFLDLIHQLGDYSYNLAYEGEIYAVSVDTDLDGIPHSDLVCNFNTFRTELMFGQVDMTEEMAEFIDDSLDSKRTIHDSFTWNDDYNKFVVVTHGSHE